MTWLYFDEDFADDGRTEALRAAAFDVRTPAEVGMLSKSDGEQIRFAASQGRLILTHNQADFARIHDEMMSAGEHHAGICIVRMEAWFGPGEIARRLDVLVEACREAGMANQLLFLSNFS